MKSKFFSIIHILILSMYLASCSTPGGLKRVASYDKSIHTIAVDGSKIFLAGEQVLEIYNINSDGNLIPISAVPDIPGPVTEMMIQGDYAYLAVAGGFGFCVIDLQNIEKPALECYRLPGLVFDLALLDRTLYVAGFPDKNLIGGGLFVWDITDPANPEYIECNTFDAEPLFPGNFIFRAETDRNPRNRNLYMLGKTFRIGVYGGLETPRNGLTVFPESDPCLEQKTLGAFRRSSFFELPANAFSNLQVIEDQVYLSAGEEFIIVGNSGVILGDLKFKNDIRAFDVQGDYAYIGVAKDGLRIVDISKPSKQKEVSNYSLKNISDVAVTGEFILISDYDRGLTVLEGR